MSKGAIWFQRIALLWAGIVIGCSFIATPAKFQAPSLSLATALEVGRATFRTMVIAEILLAIVGLVVMVKLRQKQPLFLLAILMLAIQWLAVMPLLNARTDAVSHGNADVGPPWHVAYILLEVFKVVLLLWVAFRNPKAASIADSQS